MLAVKAWRRVSRGDAEEGPRHAADAPRRWYCFEHVPGWAKRWQKFWAAATIVPACCSRLFKSAETAPNLITRRRVSELFARPRLRQPMRLSRGRTRIQAERRCAGTPTTRGLMPPHRSASEFRATDDPCRRVLRLAASGCRRPAPRRIALPVVAPASVVYASSASSPRSREAAGSLSVWRPVDSSHLAGQRQAWLLRPRVDQFWRSPLARTNLWRFVDKCETHVP